MAWKFGQTLGKIKKIRADLSDLSAPFAYSDGAPHESIYPLVSLITPFNTGIFGKFIRFTHNHPQKKIVCMKIELK
jgi:hypothetical protein